MIRTVEFYDLVERHREMLGLTQVEVAKRAFGQNSTAVIQGLRRGKSPGMERIGALCEALGLEFYVGPPRETGDTPRTIIEGKDFAAIPRYGLEASAGPGAAVIEEVEVDRLAFRRDWLARIGVAPQNAGLFAARGDSMFPLIHDGDQVMVDFSRNAPVVRPRPAPDQRRADIYVIQTDGDLRIKWVERPSADRLILYSENAALYAPEIYAGAEIDTLKIVGKAMWWSHTVKD